MLDPMREEDWTECILKVARGGSERDEMIERGLERTAMFSWRNTVDQHLAVYRLLTA
jgi:glycosyltransferase involved in cell wall biosynthesis